MIETMILAAPLKLAEIAAAALRLPWRPPPPIRPWLLRLCRHRIRLNVGKAEQVLGMTWIGLEAGLRDAAAHFRLHGLLHANGRC